MPSVRNSLQRQQYRQVESKRNIQGFKRYSECKTEHLRLDWNWNLKVGKAHIDVLMQVPCEINTETRICLFDFFGEGQSKLSFFTIQSLSRMAGTDGRLGLSLLAVFHPPSFHTLVVSGCQDSKSRKLQCVLRQKTQEDKDWRGQLYV